LVDFSKTYAGNYHERSHENYTYYNNVKIIEFYIK